MVKIAVYDNVYSRRTELKKVFKECEVFEYWDRCNHSVESIDVVLQHYGDMHQKKAGELQKLAIMVVYYGGNGEPDPRWKERPNPRKNDERIWRRLEMDGKGSLNFEEAKTLVEYAISKANNTSAKPDILTPPVNTLLLEALFILCQGYLLRHKYLKVSMDEKVEMEIYKSALTSIFLGENTDNIIEKVKSEWESLSSKPDSNKIKFEAVNIFIKAATSENPQMDTIIIENAYAALNERLGAMSEL